MVFLVDESRGAGPEFQHIRAFIERLVDTLDVGFDTTRVAVIQFSENPRVEFPLNAYSSKDEVQNAVRQLRPKGGGQLNVGAALEYVTRNVFKRPLGSRIEEGVPQFLVLVTSGRSGDEVEDPAGELRRLGVAPLAVARHTDREQLAKISLSPEYVFSVSTFRELPSLEQKLLTPITTLTSQQIRQLLSSRPYAPPGETDCLCCRCRLGVFDINPPNRLRDPWFSWRVLVAIAPAGSLASCAEAGGPRWCAGGVRQAEGIRVASCWGLSAWGDARQGFGHWDVGRNSKVGPPPNA